MDGNLCVVCNQPCHPAHRVQDRNFNSLCDWLDLAGELYTVAELQNKLKEIICYKELHSNERISGDEELMCTDSCYFKRQLVQRYGENVFFADMDERRDVVLFKDFETMLFNDLLCSRKCSRDNTCSSSASSATSFSSATSSSLSSVSSLSSASSYPHNPQHDEATNIIITAAKLILNELRTTKYDCTVYPPNNVICDVKVCQISCNFLTYFST